MKNKLILWFLILLPVTGYGQEVNSSFGFKMTVPDYWIALTREDVKENADIFDLSNVKEIPEELLKQVVPMITSGKIEIYFRPDGSTEFMDNVNVYKQIGAVPSDEKNVAMVCKGLPDELANAFKRPVTIYGCHLQTVNNIKMLYLEFDGILSGTRNIQYQIPKSKNISIVFTVTFKTESLNEVKQEISQIIGSLKLM